MCVFDSECYIRPFVICIKERLCHNLASLCNVHETKVFILSPEVKDDCVNSKRTDPALAHLLTSQHLFRFLTGAGRAAQGTLPVCEIYIIGDLKQTLFQN